MHRSELSRRSFSENGQSWFDKRYACWANNHRGWAKMKKANKRTTKHRMKRELQKQIQDGDMDDG